MMMNFIESSLFIQGALLSGTILIIMRIFSWKYSKCDYIIANGFGTFFAIISAMATICATTIIGNSSIMWIYTYMHFDIILKWKDVIFTILILMIGKALRKVFNLYYSINDNMEVTNLMFCGGILAIPAVWIINKEYLPTIIALLFGRIIWFDLKFKDSLNEMINLKIYKVNFLITSITFFILLGFILFYFDNAIYLTDAFLRFISGFVFIQVVMNHRNKI